MGWLLLGSSISRALNSISRSVDDVQATQLCSSLIPGNGPAGPCLRFGVCSLGFVKLGAEKQIENGEE